MVSVTEDPVSASGYYLFGGNISVYILFLYFSVMEFGMCISFSFRRLYRVYIGVQKASV